MPLLDIKADDRDVSNKGRKGIDSNVTNGVNPIRAFNPFLEELTDLFTWRPIC